ncbi:MAG TPA: class I SAM-dependent methyltransferase [Rhizomicrobium sp.]|nr:class I SAM-dependent methyltransferase [Rhizomicrobium sp.]
MSVFGNYSRYYDLLYRDKDYAREVDFIAGLLKRHGVARGALRELGCGTGKHALLLAEQGHVVHGVDLSAEMLEQAQARVAKAPADVAARLAFARGDARDFFDGRSFDAVLSLFHVVSYQRSNDDLIAMFRNVAASTKPGGLFLFDYWYGPAVLTERPAVRIKRMESDEIAVTRMAEPVLHINRSQVDVNYQVFIRDKVSGAVEEVRETHVMRYLFAADIDMLARATGFEILESVEWLTGQAPGAGTWGVCSVLRKPQK